MSQYRDEMLCSNPPEIITAGEPEERITCQLFDKASKTNRTTSCDYFRHAPLDLKGNNIRVFRMKYEKKGIHLELEHAELTGRHTAVSYVWGPITPTHEISINGRRFNVRQNLHLFLSAMKDTRRNDLFWVDAICINQENDQEKNHQVRQMHQMYSRAAEVCLWVGSGDSETAGLFRALKLGITSRDPNCSFCRKDNHSLNCYRGVHIRILNNEYWTRTWIIQEVLLGRGRSTLTLGSDCISLNEHGANLMRAQKSDLLRGVLDTHGWRFISKEDIIQSAEREHSAKTPVHTDEWWFFPVLDLLRDFGHCRCSDIRDRIYVMLAIVGGEAAEVVDYSLSATELYAKMLDVWMCGWPQRNETGSLEASSRVERLLRRVLELSHSRARHALIILKDQRHEWAFAVKLESIWEVKVAGRPPSLRRVLRALGPLEGRRAFEACSCTDCGAISLPFNNTLLFFSIGKASSEDGRGPYFINIKGERRFYALAYGSLGDANSPIRIVRPACLDHLNATSITKTTADMFQRASQRNDGMYLDVIVSPPDLLDLLHPNRKDQDDDSILKQMRPKYFKAFQWNRQQYQDVEE